MNVISVNVGRPREIVWKGMTVQTSIFKEPVDGPVKIGKVNLAGDQQADLTVHGGLEKAVYAYPAEHYEYWQKELPEVAFPWGAFGENLTTQGLREDTLCILSCYCGQRQTRNFLFAFIETPGGGFLKDPLECRF